jgi:hypothetical protein
MRSRSYGVLVSRLRACARLPYPSNGPPMTKNRISYSRQLTEREKDVLAVAAEIVRRRWDDDVSPELDELMLDWCMRLKAAHDELLKSLRLPSERTDDD